MKTRAFLISTLTSTLLQSLYYVVISGVTILILPRMMDTLLQDVPSNGAPPPGLFNFIGIPMLVGGIGLILAPVVYAGTGAFYAWLHRWEASPVTAEQGALGGAASAFTARFATGLLTAMGSLLINNIMYQTMGDVFTSVPGAGPNPFMDPSFIIFGGLSNVFGSLFSACLGSIVAAALGALGGSLTGAMLK